MNKKLKLCKYPNNGFGEKCGRQYLLDQFGNIYDFKRDNDPNNARTQWFIKVYETEVYGDTIPELIDELKASGWDIKRW